VNLHELLPVPYTEEALRHVVGRITRVQEFLGRRIVLENVSSYVEYSCSEMSEWEFIAEMSRRADCWLLLDLNNVFVSAHNHGFSAEHYLEAIPNDRVVQFHLGGHSEGATCLIDSHDQPVCGDVLSFFAAALRRFGPVSTMIERDDNVPPLVDLIMELDNVRSIARDILAEVHEGALA
jgi:uncharacterized protein (UPF0276 family)